MPSALYASGEQYIGAMNILDTVTPGKCWAKENEDQCDCAVGFNFANSCSSWVFLFSNFQFSCLTAAIYPNMSCIWYSSWVLCCSLVCNLTIKPHFSCWIFEVSAYILAMMCSMFGFEYGSVGNQPLAKLEDASLTTYSDQRCKRTTRLDGAKDCGLLGSPFW